MAFDAVEEAALLVPGPGWVPPPEAPRPGWGGPPAPFGGPGPFELNVESDEDDGDDEDADGDGEDDARSDESPRAGVTEEHDPHADSQSGLPASVLIGLALLPFLIPIIWLIAPAAIGHAPVLSVATPLALSLSAAVLCLAVISTIDWTPATRVKGVLLLVTLSYVTGVGLYFLTKDAVDRAKKFFGIDPLWSEFAPPGAGYAVRLPSAPVPIQDRPLGLTPLACQRAATKGMLGPTVLVVGSSSDLKGKNPDPTLGTDAWFDKAVDDIVTRAGATLEAPPEAVAYAGKHPGREFWFKLQDKTVRVVRIYVVNDRVFYLSAEGVNLERSDTDAQKFFDSFRATEAR